MYAEESVDRELEITFCNESLRNYSIYLSKGHLELTSSGEPTRLSGLLFFTSEMKGLDYARVQIIGARATTLHFISCDRHYSLIIAFLPTEPGCNFINILDMQPHPLIKVGMHEKGSLTSLVRIISNVSQMYFCP